MKALILALIALVVGLAASQSTTIATAALNNLDYASIIGGPLQAAVAAQAQASVRLIDYVQNIGFRKVNGKIDKPTYLSFKYVATNATGGDSTFQFDVPILSLVPIPFLRIDSITVSFKANIRSVKYNTGYSGYSSSQNFGAGAGTWNYYCWSCWGAWNGGVASTQYIASGTSQLDQVTSDYSLNVFVKAGQAEQPRGMARMMNLFESIIRDREGLLPQ